jgi:3-hydroxyisobutyrate dehydrogenase-like beta-hydroxyacid dehydrogenase
MFYNLSYYHIFSSFCCSKIKMVNELLEGIHFIASVEAISLGVKAGIHPWIIYDIISNAAGNSW